MFYLNHHFSPRLIIGINESPSVNVLASDRIAKRVMANKIMTRCARCILPQSFVYLAPKTDSDIISHASIFACIKRWSSVQFGPNALHYLVLLCCT